jgi:uncharacterized membrane protein HdeD (DUF308 family)
MNETTHRGLAYVVAAAISFVAPIASLLYCVAAFAFVDLITSVIFYVRVAQKKKDKRHLQKIDISGKIIHIIYSVVILTMVYSLDTYILPFENEEMTKLVAAIICFSEFFAITKKLTSITRSKSYKEINKLLNVKKHYLLNNK